MNLGKSVQPLPGIVRCLLAIGMIRFCLSTLDMKISVVGAVKNFSAML